MKRIHLLLIVLLVPAFIFAQKVENNEQITKNYTIGDFNSDGYTDDVAFFTQENNVATVEIFNSTGSSFYKNQIKSWASNEFNMTKTNGKIVSGDFDNDGFYDDIAAICEVGIDQTKIFVWINNEGIFEKQSWWFGPDFNANQVFNTIVSGDFDNDGFVDDIAAFYDYQDYTTKIFVWKSDSEKFSWPATMWYGGDFDASRIQGTLVSGDFDKDGFVDDVAAFYNYTDKATKVFVWQSDKRNFAWPRTAYYNGNYDINKLENNIVSGDFDRDGFVNDLVTFEMTERNEALARLWTMQNFKLIKGETLGVFETSQNVMLAGDFNKDNAIAEILNVNASALKVFRTEKDYVYYPENWLTCKTEVIETDAETIDFLAENRITVYPTISCDVIHINIGEIADAGISIYDMLGKQVLHKNIVSQTDVLNVNELAKGTYILNVTAKGITYKEIITVQ